MYSALLRRFCKYLKCNDDGDDGLTFLTHRLSVNLPAVDCAHLSVVQVAEASDDLLLVQLIGLQLHAPDGLHDAVILQTLLPRQLRLQRRTLLQAVHVAFLLTGTRRKYISIIS